MSLRIAAMAGICCSLVWADFSYEQTSQITGGAMAGMMRVAGAFSKAAREPQKMTVMVKDDRMATVSASHITIIDLERETMTDVDLEKKTWASITFAQMSQAMQKMGERMSQSKKSDTEMRFSADVKNTGATRTIQGLNTKQTIVTLTVEGTDNKSGQSGSMDMRMDMWMAPDVPGYAEVRAFYHRMAQKMSWTPGAGMMAGVLAQYGKGMSELSKEMSKLEGVPVLQITRIGGTGDAAPSNAPDTSAGSPQPSVQDAAGEAAAESALSRAGRLGGLAGGFGGFGRKKKKEEPKSESAPPPPSSGPAQGAILEMTTELSGFSATADASKFDVPAGFRQIDHQMTKALK